jgi:1,4-dihydroxy-6-naphthoate synthase
MARMHRLSIAYTPDSDDAFYYFGLETGKVRFSGFRAAYHPAPLAVLNRAAQEERFDVTAISSVVYPLVADRYAILSVGTSVGRGYGPVLVSKKWDEPEQLRGRRVGVGGIPTTGWFLLRRLCPEAVPVAMPFDRIGDAIVAGELDAGVMIHEELLYYPQLGLRRMLDLGAAWCQETGLPLPVGLNVIRRALGEAAMQHICTAIRRSLRYSQTHLEEGLAHVRRLGRGVPGKCTWQFVEMFANADSLRMPADVRRGLRVLLAQVVKLGLGPALPPLAIVEGRGSDQKARIPPTV